MINLKITTGNIYRVLGYEGTWMLTAIRNNEATLYADRSESNPASEDGSLTVAVANLRRK